MYTPEVKYVFKHKGLEVEIEVGYINATGNRFRMDQDIKSLGAVFNYKKTGLPYSVVEPVLVDSLATRTDAQGNPLDEDLLFYLPDVDKYALANYTTFDEMYPMEPITQHLYVQFAIPAIVD